MISSIFVAAFLMVSVFGQDRPPSGSGVCQTCPVDICLIIDTSDSIKDNTLSDLFQTLGQFAGLLNVGTGNGQVEVAVVTFGQETENPIGFKNYTDSASLAEAIRRLNRVASSSGTKTSKALDKCRELFRNDSCDNLIILVTDGTSGEGDVLTAAIERVKADSIRVIAIGIATKIRKPLKLAEINQQLLEIALNKSENRFISTFDNLGPFLTRRIVSQIEICKCEPECKCGVCNTTIGQCVCPPGYTGKDCSVCQKDIVFVLDYSKTIDDAEFETIRQIVSNIVMRVDDVGQTVRFGIVVYGFGAVQEVHLNDAYNKTTLLAKIAAIKRLRQFRGTRTINALHEAANLCISEGRSDAKHSIIVITDGRATDDKGQRLSMVRTLLNQNRITTLGIGVGDRINGTELERIVGDRANRLMSDDLDNVVKEIEACPCP